MISLKYEEAELAFPGINQIEALKRAGCIKVCSDMKPEIARQDLKKLIVIQRCFLLYLITYHYSISSLMIIT